MQLCAIINKLSERQAPLAQLDRASGYGPEGRGFESLTACHPETVATQRLRGFLLSPYAAKTGGDAKPNLCLSSAAVTQALSSSVRGAASAPIRCCRQVPVAAGTLIGLKWAHFAPVYFLRSYLKRNTNLAIIEKTREVRACIRESWKRARPWCRFCRAFYKDEGKVPMIQCHKCDHRG